MLTDEQRAAQIEEKMSATVGDALVERILERYPKLTLEQCARFEEELTRRITEELVKRARYAGNGDPGCMNFGTDYHPDNILLDACERAGLNETEHKISLRFPYKNRTWVSLDRVEHRGGYGAELFVLFNTKRNVIMDRVREMVYEFGKPEDERIRAMPHETEEEKKAYFDAYDEKDRARMPARDREKLLAFYMPTTPHGNIDMLIGECFAYVIHGMLDGKEASVQDMIARITRSP